MTVADAWFSHAVGEDGQVVDAGRDEDEDEGEDGDGRWDWDWDWGWRKG